MKKKIYIQPSVHIYEIEAEEILAGSQTEVKATLDDGSEIDYGGETKEGSSYNPW